MNTTGLAQRVLVICAALGGAWFAPPGWAQHGHGQAFHGRDFHRFGPGDRVRWSGGHWTHGWHEGRYA